MYVRNIFSFTTATVIYVKLLPDGEKISSMEESMLYAGSFPRPYPIQVILTQPTETQPLGFWFLWRRLTLFLLFWLHHHRSAERSNCPYT